MRLVSLALLLAFTSMQAFSEARPITLPTGETGFFLTRADMEQAVMDKEEFRLLRTDYASLKGFYQADLITIGRLDAQKQLFMWLSVGSATAFLATLTISLLAK